MQDDVIIMDEKSVVACRKTPSQYFPELTEENHDLRTESTQVGKKKIFPGVKFPEKY